MQLFGSLWWDGAQDCFMGLRGGFEKHCTRATLHSDTVEDLIRISVGGGTRASLRSDTVEDLIRISVEGGGGGTRATLHSDTVEDLIRISVEGPSLEDVDARESVASWFSRGQRSRKLNYRSWPFEGHVTAMEDSP